MSDDLTQMAVSEAPLIGMKPTPKTRVVIRVEIPETSDAEQVREALLSAASDTVARFELEIPAGAEVVHYTVPTDIQPTPATNKRLDNHHLLTTVSAWMGDDYITGVTVCGTVIVAHTTGAPAREKPACEKCYGVLINESQVGVDSEET